MQNQDLLKNVLTLLASPDFAVITKGGGAFILPLPESTKDNDVIIYFHLYTLYAECVYPFHYIKRITIIMLYT